jgi:hypothetical protein
MFVLAMRDQIQGSHKVPQPFSKTWALKLLRLGLGWEQSYSEQSDRKEKTAQTDPWLSQAITKSHFSFAPIVPK